MANDDSDGEELDLEEVDPFVANYRHENDKETYLNLIKRLVDHLQDKNNRMEAYIIQITEQRNEDMKIRVSYVNSKTLYLSSVKFKIIDDGDNNTNKFVYIVSNQENKTAENKTAENKIHYVSVSHRKSPKDRRFWSPYNLFNQNVDREYLKIYHSLIITISDATRFDEIKLKIWQIKEE
jgi:hypothetical protein